ncbi:MAG: hypothetical protein NTX79_00240 [Candidatus Micrarchaeota archaeon]|nr:hypothetical protein [Candidatus Micrarchaeota archaeon]
MRLFSVFALLLLASFAFANPLPPGWVQPKQEIAVPAISDTLSAMPLFTAAIAIELLVSFIVLRHYKIDFSILKYVLGANIISIPIVWAYCFAAEPFFIDWHGSVGMGNYGLIFFIILSAEAFAVAFEAYIVHYFNKKKITLAQAGWMALAANAASFALSPGEIGNQGIVSLFFILAGIIVFPFVAAYLALPRLGLEKKAVWRAYAGYVAAIATVFALSSTGPLPSLSLSFLACFVVVALINRGIGAKKALLLSLAMFFGFAAGFAVLFAVALLISFLFNFR